MISRIEEWAARLRGRSPAEAREILAILACYREQTDLSEGERLRMAQACEAATTAYLHAHDSDVQQITVQVRHNYLLGGTGLLFLNAAPRSLVRAVFPALTEDARITGDPITEAALRSAQLLPADFKPLLRLLHSQQDWRDLWPQQWRLFDPQGQWTAEFRLRGGLTLTLPFREAECYGYTSGVLPHTEHQPLAPVDGKARAVNRRLLLSVAGLWPSPHTP